MVFFAALPSASTGASTECHFYRGMSSTELATGIGTGFIRIDDERALRAFDLTSSLAAGGTFTQDYRLQNGVEFTVHEVPDAAAAAPLVKSTAELTSGGTGALSYQGKIIGTHALVSFRGELCEVGPDLLLYGGEIRTMAGATHAAVAVEGDRIIAVGSTDELRATFSDFPGPEQGLAGAVVIPGFVDTHSHVWESTAPIMAIEDARFSQGVTTQGEPTANPAQIRALDALADSGGLRLRTRTWMAYNTFCNVVLPGAPHLSFAASRDPSAQFAVLGTKVFLDGGNCFKAAPAVTFEFQPGLDPLPVSPSGDLYMQSQDLTTIVETADQRGHQVIVHAIGDAAVATALDGLIAAIRGGDNPNRHRIDHNTIVDPSRIDDYLDHNIGAVIFGEYATCRHNEGGWWGQHLDPSEIREQALYPWRLFVDRGVPVAWQADAPTFTDNSLHQWYGLTTMNQVDPEGNVCAAPPELAAHSLSVEEALVAMTISAAYQLHLESEVGSIEPGKSADMVILTANPFDDGPAALLDSSVAWTMSQGIVVHCDPSLSPIGCP